MFSHPSTINLNHLQREIRYKFGKDVSLLQEALTHPSAISVISRGKTIAYERLEFLGDRVLALIIAEMLMKRFPTEKEGDLAQRHVALVRRDALARVAHCISLGNFLILSQGEEDSGGRNNPAILANTCEALIGALFTSAGFTVAQKFINRLWTPLMEESNKPPKDAKTALQEWAQGRGRSLPIYEILSIAGSSHEPTFLVMVRIEGKIPVTAYGSSKRLAEQAAAKSLLEHIKQKV